MTISEMHIAFKLELDKTESLQYPAFLSEEIDYWLNRAVKQFTKTRYSGINPKGQGFEQSQKRIDDLRKLIREITVPCTNVNAIKPNSYILTDGFNNVAFTDNPYWMSLGEEVTISYTSTTSNRGSRATKRVGVIDITADNYRAKIDDPLSDHILHYDEAKPLRLFYNDTIEFITDEQYSVTEAFIRYIKRPAEVSYTNNIDCDLADHTHDEIVSLAVKLALDNIEQPRLQPYTQLINTME